MKLFFVAATALQLVLGVWRARLTDSSLLPAFALATLIALVGVLRLHRPLARFGALLAATAGVLSAMSAINAPLIGNVARISVPLFAFAIAATLVTAGHDRRLQVAAASVFAIALAVLEYDLTLDARWERRAVGSRLSAVGGTSHSKDPTADSQQPTAKGRDKWTTK